MASGKRICDGSGMMDRLSQLPRNLIDCILERMPIRDAARTSILSKVWRYIWASSPQLVFDEQFFKEIHIKNKYFIDSKFVKVINNVLLVHEGPILKFFLDIPIIHYDLSAEIDYWILFLSRNGIKDLELNKSHFKPYKLPSYVFSCKTLTTLKLMNCILKPPHEFGGFLNLVELKLVQVSFSANVSATLLQNAPVLKILIFHCCTGLEHLRIYAPKLYYFSLVNNQRVDWQWFVTNQHLKIVQITLRKEVQNIEQGKLINLGMLLKNMPKVQELWFNGSTLKFLAAGNSPEKLPIPVQLLKHLKLRNVAFDDLDQIQSVLCLLRNSPNLKNLLISVCVRDHVEPVVRYLEAPNCMDMKLDNLQTIKIRFIKGLKAELLFIKLLLASSTSLKKMIIERSTEIDSFDGLIVFREILQFTRASTEAEITYLDPKYS